MRYYISELSNHVNQQVELKGWAYQMRSSGKVKFLELRDGTGIVPCVFFGGECDEYALKCFEQLTQECSVKIVGTVRKHPKKENIFEIGVKTLEILAPSVEYPITPKEHGTDFLMENRHLWIRSRRQHAILRIRHEIISAIRDFFDGRGFTLTDAPIFTPNACEGTTELYSVEHVNGEIMYLTQSGQLYIEAAMYGVGRVFDFGPVFRAEKSKTRRHLNEFWMMDAEIPFIQQDENMQIQEDLLKYIIRQVLEKNNKDLTLLGRDMTPLSSIVDKPWPRMTHEEFVADLIAK